MGVVYGKVDESHWYASFQTAGVSGTSMRCTLHALVHSSYCLRPSYSSIVHTGTLQLFLSFPFASVPTTLVTCEIHLF